MEKVMQFIKNNRDKFRTHQFVANAIILVLFFVFWGVTEKTQCFFTGAVSGGGAISGFGLAREMRAAHVAAKGMSGVISSGQAQPVIMMLIPLMSGFMIYSVLTGFSRFLRTAKILLIIGLLLPGVLFILSGPIRWLGVTISLVAAISLFFSSKVQPQLDKLFALIEKKRGAAAVPGE